MHRDLPVVSRDVSPGAAGSTHARTRRTTNLDQRRSDRRHSRTIAGFCEKVQSRTRLDVRHGDKSEIDALLQALGAGVTNKNDHTPMVLIGNEAADQWTRAYGLSSPAKILDLIQSASSRK